MDNIVKVSGLNSGFQIPGLSSKRSAPSHAKNKRDEIPNVPVFHEGSVMDRYSKSQIKGGFSAAEIMVLGKERAQGRKLEIQETKAKIREERIAKEEANQRAQKALAIANEERMARELETKRANDAIAELAAYKKARKLGPEDEG